MSAIIYPVYERPARFKFPEHKRGYLIQGFSAEYTFRYPRLIGGDEHREPRLFQSAHRLGGSLEQMELPCGSHVLKIAGVFVDHTVSVQKYSRFLHHINTSFWLTEQP